MTNDTPSPTFPHDQYTQLHSTHSHMKQVFIFSYTADSAFCLCLESRFLHFRSYRNTFFFFSSRRRHTRFDCDWSSDVCSSDLALAFDNRFYPKLFDRTSLTLSVSFPLWDNARRELALSQARADRDVARAVRRDLERAVQHDVTAAYDGYLTARAAAGQAGEGLLVARENFRVQQSRYRAGPSTILDLLHAHADLDDPEERRGQGRH